MGKKRSHLSLPVWTDLKMKWKGKLNKRSHITFIIDKGWGGGFSLEGKPDGPTSPEHQHQAELAIHVSAP